MVDFDKDGKLDIVAGCFEGFVYFIPGHGGMKFGAPQRLKDRNEDPVQLGEFWDYDAEEWGETKGEDPTRDLCVYPIAVDWDGDGDLDLLLGGYTGHLAVRLNEGSAHKPVFANRNTPVPLGSELVQDGGAVSPAIADWDGDGKWDLVCGNSSGLVVWHRNIGTVKEPEFEAAQVILDRPKDSEMDRPCSYLKIAVGDVNGDETLDLVIGAKDADRNGAIWVYLRP